MKRVLITGATDGIGKAVAIQLDRKGYQTYLFGRSEEKMKALEETLQNVLKTYCFDMQDRQSLYDALDDVANDGGVDALVNNAGAVIERGPVLDITIEGFEKTMNLNCTSHLICIQKTLPRMLEQNSGDIINILSSCCKYNVLNMGNYTASKKAMEAISHILAKEVKDSGVKVCAVYPGGVDTNFRAIDRPDYLRPETIAKQVLFILENNDGMIQEIITRPAVENNY